MSDEHTTVTYTVKELLARLDAKIDDLIALVERKAEKAELDALMSRVETLERERAQILAIAAYKKWLIGLSVSVCGVLIAVIAVLVR